MYKRIFLIDLEGLGVGGASDNEANTLKHILDNRDCNLNILEKLGLLNLVDRGISNFKGYHGLIIPKSEGCDSFSGLREMMGIISSNKYEYYSDGFPLELISKIKNISGRDVIGNVCSSDDIINELGQMQESTGALIVYTSSDSVMKVAVNEKLLSADELYEICKNILEYCTHHGYNIARVMAKPFVKKSNEFVMSNKSISFTNAPGRNVISLLDSNGYETLAIGKVSEIFSDSHISKSVKTVNNLDGLMKLIDFAKFNFNGLCVVNFSDLDYYGHKRQKNAFLKCLEDFNYYLPIFLNQLRKDDLMIITSSHGNDPTINGFSHTKEKLPLIVYSPNFVQSKTIVERKSLSDIGATIIDNFEVSSGELIGDSFLDELV